MAQGVYVILRDVTWVVKIYPFLYAVMLAVCILCGMLGSEDLATTLDALFYVSPVVVLMLFRLSFALKLCNWHRAQCLLPMLPMVVGYADNFIVMLGYYAALANFLSVFFLIVASIVNAYNMFIKPKENAI